MVFLLSSVEGMIVMSQLKSPYERMHGNTGIQKNLGLLLLESLIAVPLRIPNNTLQTILGIG